MLSYGVGDFFYVTGERGPGNGGPGEEDGWWEALSESQNGPFESLPCSSSRRVFLWDNAPRRGFFRSLAMCRSCRDSH